MTGLIGLVSAAYSIETGGKVNLCGTLHPEGNVGWGMVKMGGVCVRAV